VGHRARCRTCGAVFDIAAKPFGLPTEDDILRWLRETEDYDETAEERLEPLVGSPPMPQADQETPDGSGAMAAVIGFRAEAAADLTRPRNIPPRAKSA
jgi:hypothetical protein